MSAALEAAVLEFVRREYPDLEGDFANIANFFLCLGVSVRGGVRHVDLLVSDFLLCRRRLQETGYYESSVTHATIEFRQLPSPQAYLHANAHIVDCDGCSNPVCSSYFFLTGGRRRYKRASPAPASPPQRARTMPNRTWSPARSPARRTVFPLATDLPLLVVAAEPSPNSVAETGYWSVLENIDVLQNRFKVSGAVRQMHITEDERHFKRLIGAPTMPELRSLVPLCAVEPDAGKLCGICDQGVTYGRRNKAIACDSCKVKVGPKGVFFLHNAPTDRSRVTVVCERCWSTCACKRCASGKLCEKMKKYQEWVRHENWESLMCEWVRCTSCGQDAHRCCALLPYKEGGSLFRCPTCLLRSPDPFLQRPARSTCRDLKVTEVAAAIESFAAIPALCVREVNRAHATLHFSATIRKMFAAPPVLGYTERVLLYFYQDMLVFIIIVHEFDQCAAAANANRVYIDYIDSAGAFCAAPIGKLFVAYLQTVYVRAYKYVHLWACAAGQQWYILADPPPRRQHTDAQLLEWYRMQFRACPGVVAEHDFFDLVDPFPDSLDGVPIFNDVFVNFLERKGALQVEDPKLNANDGDFRFSTVRRFNLVRYWEFSPPDRGVVMDDTAHCPTSAIFKTRDSFIRWQEEIGGRFSDLRCVAHFSCELVRCLLKE